jgi:DNA mismatch repair protein MutL
LPQSGQSAFAGRVRRLPDALVDQIAAGEVVERPASVVKELVENALDAGAGRVRVELRGGGIELVAVTDDGTGMPPEDARLALERHATSKLRDADDLARIRSFGFRGEALPAIAAVSRFRLRTRARGAAEGIELRVEAGRIVEERAAGGPEGTRVEVADLFASIPARRKFLKHPATEWGHAADWLARAALALPEVHFEILRDDRPATVWPAVRERLDRIAAVLSEAEAAALVRVERAAGADSLLGYFSRPDAHRPTAAGIFLFVNGRPVRDRLLRHALLEAYRDILPRGRFPSALVFLAVPPEAVDVNVHPAKWEVRFADPRRVHDLVRGAARSALGSRAWLGAGAAATETAVRPHPGAPAAAAREAAPAASDWLFAGAGRAPAAGPDAAQLAIRFTELRLLGQLLGAYLLVEDKDGLLLVDQHAAHERVLYERLRAAWLAHGVARQALLAPEVVELQDLAGAALGAELALAARLGFEVEPFDARSVAVRAVPALLAGRDPAALVRGLADELAEARALGAAPAASSRHVDLADRALATLACHAARTAGEVLETREQRALLDSLDTIPWAPTCPHGRPVAVSVSLAEVERRFGRR